jgi:23S rRNA pseudouridine1911/1915/1917 synthase
MTQQRFQNEGDEEQRLDRFLHDRLQNSALSRSQLKILIESGAAELDGRVVTKAGTLVRPGSIVILTLSDGGAAEHGAAPSALELPLVVLHEDESLIVINKQVGLTMHPGAGNKSETLVNALVHHFGAQKPELFRSGARPGIVHRLDKDTSGVVVVAKTAAAHAFLAEQFASRTIEREYRALVFSTPRALRPVNTADEGEVQTNIGRDPRNRKRMAVVPSGGKTALTRWRVLERMSYGCFLAVKLGTGRTHQIRVHMAHIGCPIIGDPVYGDASMLPAKLKVAAQKFGHQALHAGVLEFTHPDSGRRVRFEAQVPRDFEGLLQIFRAYE